MFIIGFPGQIRKFDNQIHFNFIQIRQILSCRENYHSNLNDQIAKILTFSWFRMKSVYFRMIKTLIWKLAKWIRKAD